MTGSPISSWMQVWTVHQNRLSGALPQMLQTPCNRSPLFGACICILHHHQCKHLDALKLLIALLQQSERAVRQVQRGLRLLQTTCKFIATRARMSLSLVDCLQGCNVVCCLLGATVSSAHNVQAYVIVLCERQMHICQAHCSRRLLRCAQTLVRAKARYPSSPLSLMSDVGALITPALCHI
jgi:hypothetical protein